jgi:D-alanyl-D-alanine carboxypeptidase (penicillin-binding protein 5/6)
VHSLQVGKNDWLRFVVCIMIVCLLSVSIHIPLSSAQTGFDLAAESAILIEAKTGKILFQKNQDVQLPPASMSKMMTEYLVLEAIEKGHFEWNTVVRASEYAHYLGALDGTSRVWLAHGEERTVEELYTAMAVYSANDATVALAELVSGTEAEFVRIMNQRAKELGMTNTIFVNSTGLPNNMLGKYIPAGAPEDENAMSAKDTAILARELVNHYPDVLRFSSIPDKPVGYFDVRLINFNWMLPGHPYGEAREHTYPGLDGLKTGYTSLAGYCFTGTVEKNGMRLISVVMRTDSMGARFKETRKLLDYGFNNFIVKEVAKEGESIKGLKTLPVIKGIEEQVAIGLSDSLTTVIHKDEEALYSLTFAPNQEKVDKSGALKAPIKKGDIVGVAQLVYTGELNYGFIHDEAKKSDVVAMMTKKDVEKAGWFRLFMRSIGDFFGSLWDRITGGVEGLFS